MCVTPNSTTGWEESAPPCDQAARGKTRVSRGATSPSDHSERASRSASVSAPGRDGTTRDDEGSAKRRARHAERGREPSFVSNQTGKRIGQNEALFREVNERIGGLQGSLGIAGALDIVCECGTADCTERFSISRDDYVALRDNPRRFVVVPRPRGFRGGGSGRGRRRRRVPRRREDGSGRRRGCRGDGGGERVK